MIEGFHIFFPGTETKQRVNGRGVGAEFYDVKSKNKNIEGCYKKTDFHNVIKEAGGYKYSIYKQSGGPFILTINIYKDKGPWIFADGEGHIKYE